MLLNCRPRAAPSSIFTLGEPDQDTPDAIIEAGVAALRSGDTHYTGSAGKLDLRKAICEKLAGDNAVTYTPDEIVVTSGVKQIIFEAFAATLQPGDEVIIPVPYWVSYPDIVRLNGATPIVIECLAESEVILTPEALEAAITPKTRWLIINSPSNPSGAVLSEAQWKGLLDVLARHPHVAVMTDEIYEKIVFDGVQNKTPVAVASDMKDRCLIVNGMSKAYAMTGWRIVYAAGPAPLIKAIVKLIRQSTTCTSAFVQIAAAAALRGDQEPVAKMVEIYRERRDLIVSLLNDIDGVNCSMPGGAFYIFPDIRQVLGRKGPNGAISSDLELVNYLLDEAGVAVMDGTSYGMPGFLRLSFAT
ncbi:pyridoxal phosphate-dependent aminotransferase [Breoghania sp.]|uniref:pyridoxal phosphate-dependent aminotransferase n=1 Tax=Breoghania sp. TaxID=2065378 RepID=UPI00262400E1|nr:pyridoxal phosphate-dependent aminotransferase [Breoghania sp.]MDJ0930722.1 pyridoxal phosphate-dependent aminotransferase [Breoghania sp.]